MNCIENIYYFQNLFSGWAGNCGDGGVGGSSWYIICEKCRSTYMSQLAVPHQPQQPRELTEVKNRANAFFKPRKKSLTSGFSLNSAAHPNSHIIMTNNAMFLLGNFFEIKSTYFLKIIRNF